MLRQCGKVEIVLTRKWGRAVLILAQAQIHCASVSPSVKWEEKSSLGVLPALTFSAPTFITGYPDELQS